MPVVTGNATPEQVDLPIATAASADGGSGGGLGCGGFVWMARGKVHAASAATIHMLAGTIRLSADSQEGGQEGTGGRSREPDSTSEPCLIFFVRQVSTPPPSR